MKPTFGSLFAGIGGIDIGLERAGWECKWQVENDDFCNRVLKKHWPNVKRYGDIKKTNFRKLEKVDMLAGGFPCQPVSHAGKRKGDKDERWLWPEFLRAICEIKPGWVLVENVPGLRSADSGRLFGDILRDLASQGYDAEWCDLRASDFGALHKRERVFIVAYSKEFGWVQRRQDLSCDKEHIITDDWEERIQRFVQEKIRRGEGFSWCKDVRRVEVLQGRQDIPEPLFCGTRDGILDWTHRIGAIGNAVVPDCAEFIGKAIIKLENPK